MYWECPLCWICVLMPTFNCYSSSNSNQTAYPKPWPCCGWKVAPASFSGTYYLISGSPCGTWPAVSTPITLTRSNDCGNVYQYTNPVGVYMDITLTLCTSQDGTVSPLGFSLAPGVWTPDAGSSCSFVGGVHYFTLNGTLLVGGTCLIRFDLNTVTI